MATIVNFDHCETTHLALDNLTANPDEFARGMQAAVMSGYFDSGFYNHKWVSVQTDNSTTSHRDRCPWILNNGMTIIDPANPTEWPIPETNKYSNSDHGQMNETERLTNFRFAIEDPDDFELLKFQSTIKSWLTEHDLSSKVVIVHSARLNFNDADNSIYSDYDKRMECDPTNPARIMGPRGRLVDNPNWIRPAIESYPADVFAAWFFDDWAFIAGLKYGFEISGAHYETLVRGPVFDHEHNYE